MGTSFNEILIKIRIFSLNKSFWKCHLENGGHFSRPQFVNLLVIWCRCNVLLILWVKKYCKTKWITNCFNLFQIYFKTGFKLLWKILVFSSYNTIRPSCEFEARTKFNFSLSSFSWNIISHHVIKVSECIHGCQGHAFYDASEILITHYSGVIMSATASQIMASRLFTQPFLETQIKENIKSPCHWPMWREFTGDRWFLRTKGQ